MKQLSCLRAGSRPLAMPCHEHTFIPTPNTFFIYVCYLMVIKSPMKPSPSLLSDQAWSPQRNIFPHKSTSITAPDAALTKSLHSRGDTFSSLRHQVPDGMLASGQAGLSGLLLELPLLCHYRSSLDPLTRDAPLPRLERVDVGNDT